MIARGEPELVGRSAELRLLDLLISAARDSNGSVLVIRGEAGVGKSALLDYCSGRASGFEVRQAVGVESEMELPFAALHQLCAPMLDRLDSIPSPQQAALGVALGLTRGAAPDRFLVALATLSLLSEAAAQRPLLCLVDDAQWLDNASRQAFAFVARRLVAESVAMVFAVRAPTQDDELGGLPEVVLPGLRNDDARKLLETVIVGRLDVGARDRLLAEARGNPLALLELPRRMSPTQLPGGLGLLHPNELPGRIEEAFVERLDKLPEDGRMLLLVAAAEPADDPLLLWRAADQLGIHASAVAAAEREGLLTIDERVRFRHPLVRSAAYRSAPLDDRRRAHLALANATNPRSDPDRRAWHLAAAASGPDEQVAQELELSADRAKARGGLAAAAAFLRRSAVLTADSGKGVERTLAAARSSLHAGEFGAALEMLSMADSSSLDELQQARVEYLRAQVISASGAASEAPTLLLDAAKRLEPFGAALAGEAYLDAWGAALFAGNLTDTTMRDVSRAVQARPRSIGTPYASDLLLDAMSTLMTHGRVTAAPMLRRAVNAFLTDDPSMDKGMGWAVVATTAAAELWDFDNAEAALARQVQLAREAGALASLAIALHGASVSVCLTGDLEAAARMCAEADVITEATGTRMASYGGMLLAALRGREVESFAMLETARRQAAADGAGYAMQVTHYATALLCNGLGRYEDALAAAQLAWDVWPDWCVSVWAMVEFAEAAARLRRFDLAVEAVQRIVSSAEASGSDWALGISARSRALISDHTAAESLYHQAIEHLEATRLRPDLARAHLLYGEWLRRDGQRVDSRAQLQVAHSMLSTMGADGFTERARSELLATGMKVQRRAEKQLSLTPQEAHIARLAADGHTNVQIGAELYLSRHTIEWHMRKVFQKLGISSRSELRGIFTSETPGGRGAPALS